jgi:hypothetical protein
MIVIELVGYEEDNEPIFVVTSTVSGSKFAARQGDEQFQDFSVQTRKATDKLSSIRDLGLGFVALSVLVGSMGPLLEKVIFDRTEGEKLLAQYPNQRYTFACLKEFELSPVFLNRGLNVKRKLKHSSDAVPNFKAFSPMTTSNARRWIRMCGTLAGFDSPVTSRNFRLTYSYKVGHLNHAKDWQVSSAMGHESRTKELARLVYRPTDMPNNIAEAKFKIDMTTDSASDALARVGSFTRRPNPSTIDQQVLNKIYELSKAHEDGEVEDEQLIEKFAEINGGRRLTIMATKISIQRLPIDNWQENVAKRHPYESICDDKLTKVIRYLLNGGPYQCPSCNGPMHRLKQRKNVRSESGMDHFNMTSKCYEKGGKKKGKCLCAVCHQV